MKIFVRYAMKYTSVCTLMPAHKRVDGAGELLRKRGCRGHRSGATIKGLNIHEQSL